MRSWDPGIQFFFSSRLNHSFGLINKNKLKNILLKFVNDIKLWYEIEKMLDSGFINILSDSIYLDKEFISFSPLSRFLLNVYLDELDQNIKVLCYNFNGFSRFSDKKIEKKNVRKYSLVLMKTLPVKLEKNLLNIRKLSAFNNLRFNFYKNYFSEITFSPKFKTFSRKIFYCRFLDYLLLGFVGSRDFSKRIIGKVTNFVRSSLHFNCDEINLISSAQNPMLFLGFYLKKLNLANKTALYDSIRKSVKKKYFLKVIARLDAKRKRLTNIISKRFSSEIFLLIKETLKNKKMYLKDLRDEKIWLYIFQLECVRSAQVFRLINTEDIESLIPEDFFDVIRHKELNHLVNYRRFSFNFYLKKLQIALKNSISCVSPGISKCVTNTDLALFNNLVELKKNLEFCYENLYINVRSKSSVTTFGEVPSSYIFDNGKSNDLVFSSGFSTEINSIENSLVDVTAPIEIILQKLDLLGFFNFKDKKPISNLKYLFLDDEVIISLYSYYARTFLIWFRCCDNFAKIKTIIEYIRQSCILTLCRKHNKSRDWVVSVYTLNLIFCKTSLSNKPSFPEFNEIFLLKRKFLINKSYYLLFNEKFFLN